ncbi:MAG: hypothetical protein HN712_00825 [Gemmatimonadetes bacterium]|jgi:virginiamycin B lyase|nr:hypothetical protein [Gemmatimonadota bacterium]MBT7858813.1 hypothetical protein [Gemmatimonadota bacterium]
MTFSTFRFFSLASSSLARLVALSLALLCVNVSQTAAECSVILDAGETLDDDRKTLTFLQSVHVPGSSATFRNKEWWEKGGLGVAAGVGISINNSSFGLVDNPIGDIQWDWNDEIEAVIFEGDCSGTRVTLFEDTDFRGGQIVLTEPTQPLPQSWRDKASGYSVDFAPDFHTEWAGIAGNAGNAVDVGAGADGSVWVIDDHSNQIYRYTGSTWEGMGGQANRIDSGPDGDAYVVVVDGGVWYGNGTVGSWAPVSGHAVDVGAGANGFVWCIGLDGRIWRHNPSGGDYWIDMGGHGLRVDAGPNGDAYVVTADGSVWYGNGTVGDWVPMPGAKASDIGVGADGSVWITYAFGGIGRWNTASSTWERTDGHARQVSVSADGTPWVVQESSQIWTGTPQ